MRITKGLLRFDPAGVLLTPEEELFGRRSGTPLGGSVPFSPSARPHGERRGEPGPTGPREHATVPSRGVPAPLFVGELRIDGSRGVLRVVDDGSLSLHVDTRHEGEELIAELRQAAAVEPVAFVTCADLLRLHLGGAAHDPRHQDLDGVLSCECVGRSRSEAYRSSSPDGSASCRVLEDFTYRRVRFVMCCRCSATLTAASVAAAAAAILGTDPGTAGAAVPHGRSDGVLRNPLRPLDDGAATAFFSAPAGAPQATALPLPILPAAEPVGPGGRREGRAIEVSPNGRPDAEAGAAVLFPELETEVARR